MKPDNPVCVMYENMDIDFGAGRSQIEDMPNEALVGLFQIFYGMYGIITHEVDRRQLYDQILRLYRDIPEAKAYLESELNRLREKLK